MTPKEEAHQLLHTYRMLFWEEGEDYGEEILVSVLSKKCALIAVDELIKVEKRYNTDYISDVGYYQLVKRELGK